MKAITVLLCDDHSIVRQGLRALLETAGDMNVIGEAENGRQAVTQARLLKPEVVVMDLAMPQLNGVEAARQILRQTPKARVLILSSYSDEINLRRAVEAGVAGYLMKESAANELLEAVRATREGGASFSPVLMSRLTNELMKGNQRDKEATIKPANLTCRQAEILQLIAEGYCTKEIAGLLSLSIKSIEKHRQSLMDNLDLHKVATLTKYAVSNGVVESNQSPIVWPGDPPQCFA